MKVNTSKSKNAESFYIKQSYIDGNGKSTSRTIRKLGTLNELLVEHGPTPVSYTHLDVYKRQKEYVTSGNSTGFSELKNVRNAMAMTSSEPTPTKIRLLSIL